MSKWKCPICGKWHDEPMAKVCMACKLRTTPRTTGYAWLITVDHVADIEEDTGTNCNAVGITGPAGTALAADDIRFLPHAEFRMFDDDGELYYEGLFVGDAGSEDGFGPLDDFGRPNAGCTRIDYLRGAGTWETL